MKRLFPALPLASAFLLLPLIACAAQAGAPAAKLGDLVTPSLGPTEAAAMVRDLEPLPAREFLDRGWALVARRDPEGTDTLGLSERFGAPRDELTDVSDSYSLGTRELFLALVDAIDHRQPEPRPEDELALAAFRRWLGDKALRIELSLGDFPVTPVVNSVDWLLTNYFTEILDPRDEAEARRFILLLGKVPAKMAAICEAVELRARQGVKLPSFLADAAMGGIKQSAVSPARYNPYYRAFESKLGASIPAETRGALLAEAAAAVEANVAPSFARLGRTVAAARGGSGAAAAPDSGASSLPRGREYYAACLAQQTTTRRSAEDIHETGKRELERIQAQIRGLFGSLGYDESGDLGSLYGRLRTRSGTLSGQALLDRAKALIAGVEARMGEIVPRGPKSRVEAVFGASGAYYQQPSLDGSRPGRYYIARGDTQAAAALPSTLYHETVPGHHLQIARALEADIPAFLAMADFNAYIEGWALYAERLVAEMGLYEGNPEADLYRLQMEALRAARLVADTGINALGWDFGRTADFLVESTGLDRGFAYYEAMRYLSFPAQATSYYTGFLELLALRERAQLALGELFDPRRFHEAVLAGGALPLDALGTAIDAYIAAEKAR